MIELDGMLTGIRVLDSATASILLATRPVSQLENSVRSEKRGRNEC